MTNQKEEAIEIFKGFQMDEEYGDRHFVHYSNTKGIQESFEFDSVDCNEETDTFTFKSLGFDFDPKKDNYVLKPDEIKGLQEIESSDIIKYEHIPVSEYKP